MGQASHRSQCICDSTYMMCAEDGDAADLKLRASLGYTGRLRLQKQKKKILKTEGRMVASRIREDR